MSSCRPSANDEPDRNRDPRRRDRSRSEIRRPNNIDTIPIASEPVRPAQSTSTNSALEFFQTLGLNSQLIQALINANPPKVEQIQPQQQVLVNNAQEFASFLSKSYGLDSTINQPVNRDPRRRQISTTPVSVDISLRPEPRSVLYPTPSVPPMSIDESYKQFLSSINQTLVDDETRRRLQRIELLDNELDKLHRMNIELTKNSERRARRRTSTKDKDPLLKENENLQNELIHYLKTLKTTMINHYSVCMLSNQIIFPRQ